MKTSFFLFLILCLSACRQHAPLQIRGDVPAIPDGMVYLVRAGQWRSPVDSARCINGRFEFRFRTIPSFFPFDAALHFYPAGDREHPRRIQFINPYYTHKIPLLSDHFWLETGITSITAVDPANVTTTLKAGPETELMFRHQPDDLGWAGQPDTTQRQAAIGLLKKEILAHPGSYFLCQRLYQFRYQYQKSEFLDLFNLFNDQVRYSPTGRAAERYAARLPDPGTAYPVLYLASSGQSREPVVDSSARLNMLVFWASWCTPCRKEIPELKILYQKYAGRGLRLTGISIDTQKEPWLSALAKEQLPWRQLIVDENKLAETEDLFRFTTIPLMIFVDKKGREIARYADYTEDQTGRYDSLIKINLQP